METLDKRLAKIFIVISREVQMLGQKCQILASVIIVSQRANGSNIFEFVHTESKSSDPICQQ